MRAVNWQLVKCAWRRTGREAALLKVSRAAEQLQVSRGAQGSHEGIIGRGSIASDDGSMESSAGDMAAGAAGLGGLHLKGR